MERSLSLVFDLETDGCTMMSPPSTALLSMISMKPKRTRSTIKAIKSLFRGVCKCLWTRTVLLGTTLLVMTYLFSLNSIVGTARDRNCIDTLLLSRLYHADILEARSTPKRWDQMPLQMYGRHSLEAYGYRLKCYKGQYGKTTDWSMWSQEMEDYCVQDVNVTTKLWTHFKPYLNGSR